MADLFGEPGYSTYERVWTRPALDVNGIWGGFQGEGIKTVIPSKAHAKISCRLVPDQDPDTIVRCVKAHIEKYSPKGVRVTVRQISSKAEPYLIPFDHPGNQAARNVLKALYGKDPYYSRMGGTRNQSPGKIRGYRSEGLRSGNQPRWLSHLALGTPTFQFVRR